MTVVAAYLYHNGKRVRPIALGEKIAWTDQESEFVWIGIADPTLPEMDALQLGYGLHALAVDDAINGDQLPKVEVYGDQLFIVANTARLDDSEIVYGETAIFVGRRHIISVRHGSSRSHTALREQLEAAPSLLMHGSDYVLHAILDFIVDGYLPLVEQLEEEVLEMEARAIDSFLDRSAVNRIFNMRRELIRFQRVLGPMGEVAAKLVRIDLPCINADTRLHFRNVHDHVRRVQGKVDGLRESLISVVEFSNLLEQQRTGVITRQLAAWAAILAVPTAIAGIYGMNFKYMPELSSPYGYFVVLVVILAICGLLYRRFKRLGWL